MQTKKLNEDSFVVTSNVMGDMFNNKYVQKALRLMANYTLRNGKEAGIYVYANRDGFGAVTQYGDYNTMGRGMFDLKDEFEGGICDKELEKVIFHTHTHPDSIFPMFSKGDLEMAVHDNNYTPNGVSVVFPNKLIKTLIFVPKSLKTLDSAHILSDKLDGLIEFRGRKFRYEHIAEDKKEIIDLLNQFGRATFLDFRYIRGVYVPDKKSLSELKKLAPLINLQDSF